MLFIVFYKSDLSAKLKEIDAIEIGRRYAILAFYVRMCPDGENRRLGRNGTIMGFLAGPDPLGRTFSDFVQ